MAVTYDDTQGAAPIAETITREVTAFKTGKRNARTIKSATPLLSNEKGKRNARTMLGKTAVLSTGLGKEPVPILQGFDLDLTSGVKQLTLRFNKFIDPTTLDVTKITIQDAAAASSVYPLVDSFTTATTHRMTLVIDLGSTDFAALTGIPGLADSQAHTWIRLAAGMVKDTSLVDSGAIADGSAKQVTTFTI